jgi:hypothetical protein
MGRTAMCGASAGVLDLISMTIVNRWCGVDDAEIED